MISSGYRKESLHFQFKDPSLNLFKTALTSQRTYQFECVDIKEVTFGALSHYTTTSEILFKMQGVVSKVLDGEFKEKGLFAGYFSAPPQKIKGLTSFFGLNMGSSFYFCDDDFQLAPLLGFGINGFTFHSKNKSTCGYFVGPTLGFEALFQLNETLRILGSFDYCFATFRGKSSKECFEKKAFFDKNAYGRGLLLSFGLDKSFLKMWNGGFKFSWNDWLSFRQGELRLNVRNTHDHFLKDQPFGPLTWNSFSLEVSLNRAF
jgi:hypothetical protein